MEWPFRGRDGEFQRAHALLRIPGSAGTVIAGPAYVGRTRFLAELLDRVGARRPVVRLAATRSSREVGYGVLGSLAPGPSSGPAEALEALAAGVGPDGILAIDDAQWIDDLSAHLVFELVRSRRAALALTLRRGHTPPHAFVTLVKDGYLDRVDLDPLDRRGSDAVVEAALAGRVATALLHELHETCGGYPMLLRAFVEDAVATGILVRDDATWVATGALRPPPILVDDVRDQLRQYGPEVTEGIQLIALGEPLEAEILDRLVDAEVTAALERTELVAHDPVTGRYRITTPGACMVVRAALEPSVMRVLSRRLSSAMVDQGLHAEDLVRLAIWRLDAGDDTDNSLFVRAAERAASTFDHQLTERLARAALPGGGIEARILLANALIHQRRNEEAEEQLAVATDLAATDENRARVAGVRSRLLFFRLGRTQEAVDVLEQACEAISEARLIDQLRGSLALLVSMLGDLDRALELCALVLDRADSASAAKVVASTSAAFARVLRGELAEARRCCEEGLAHPATEVTRDYPLARPLLEFLVMMAHSYEGELDTAERIGQDGYRDALAAGVDEVSGVWASQLAGVLLQRGDLDGAIRYSAEARRLLSKADPLGVHSLAHAAGATALAESGRVAEAQKLLDVFISVRALHDVRSELQEQRARAVIHAATGELETAAAVGLAAAEVALSHDHRIWAMTSAHHAVRLGYPEKVVDLMRTLVPRVEGSLLPTMADHAVALHRHDVEGLVDVGHRFARMGALLWAAEAYAQASRLAADAGERRRASLLRARAGSLLGRCPGAATPAIRGLQVTPLTRREHEIALLASGGLTSREIAERLVVSPRTVDNHLASVYRKLDISGRDQLAAALAVDATGP